MDRTELSNELNKYISQYNNSNASFEEVIDIIARLEVLLKNFLARNPDDLEIWLKLIRIEFQPHFSDFELFQEYSQNALAIEQRPIIYVLRALFEEINRYIPPETYKALCQTTAVTPDDKAMVAYMKASAVHQLVGAQPKEYELHLLESIQYGPTFFWNHVDLGEYYVRCNQINRGKALIAKALQNILHIYHEDDFRDPTDIYEFLNERVKGIHLSKSNYNRIAKKLAALEKIDTSNEYWDII